MFTEQVLPNLMLAGAPKCGTTSVYDWLVSHPSISGGVDKELFYLMDKGDWKFNPKSNWLAHGDASYAKYFKQPNRYVVDGTTLTIYQQCALEFARSHDLKILLFIREPSDRIYSTFKYFRDTRTVLPQEMTFVEFLDAVENGEDFGGINQLSEVIQQSMYSKYIADWVKVLGKENVKVFDFQSLKNDKLSVMKQTCEWLDIDATYYDEFDFTHKNETAVIRYRFLNKVKESIAVKVKSQKFKDLLRPFYNKLNKRKPNNSLSMQEQEVKEHLKQQLSCELEKVKAFLS